MATGQVWDRSLLSHSRPKIFGYFPSRPKPGTGRGMQSHPYYKVKIKISSPARLGLTRVFVVEAGLGWSY